MAPAYGFIHGPMSMTRMRAAAYLALSMLAAWLACVIPASLPIDISASSGASIDFDRRVGRFLSGAVFYDDIEVFMDPFGFAHFPPPGDRNSELPPTFFDARREPVPPFILDFMADDALRDSKYAFIRRVGLPIRCAEVAWGSNGIRGLHSVRSGRVVSVLNNSPTVLHAIAIPRIRALPFAANVAMLWTAMVLCHWAVSYCRTAVRHRRGQCTACGYSLLGHSSPQCPECGAARAGGACGSSP